jgi:hypothetical protein
MARPSLNYCEYFPHDRDMRNHRKIKAIRVKFGVVGYAIWVMLLEYLTGSDGNVMEYSDIELELISGDFGVSVTEMRDVLDYCIRLEMLFIENGFLSSKSLDKRLEPVYVKRKQAKRSSDKQDRLNGSFCNRNAEQTVVSVTEMPQIRIDKNKEDNSIIIVEGKPSPSKEDLMVKREIVFMDTLKPFVPTYGKDMIRKFFDYWREPNISRSKMKFELQKTWDLKLRLNTWERNQVSFSRNGSKISSVNVDKSGMVA